MNMRPPTVDHSARAASVIAGNDIVNATAHKLLDDATLHDSHFFQCEPTYSRSLCSAEASNRDV